MRRVARERMPGGARFGAALACAGAVACAGARADAPVCGVWRISDPQDLLPFFEGGSLRWEADLNGVNGADGSIGVAHDPEGSGRRALRLADDAGPGGAASGGATVQVGLRWVPTGLTNQQPIRELEELWFDLEVYLPSASFAPGSLGKVGIFELGRAGLSRDMLLEVRGNGSILWRRRGTTTGLDTAGTGVGLEFDRWQRVRLAWARHEPGVRPGRMALQTSADGEEWSALVEAGHGWTDTMSRFRLVCDAVDSPGGAPVCWFAGAGWRTRFKAWEAALSDGAMWADCAHDPFYWCHVMDVSQSEASLYGHLQAWEFSGDDRLEYDVRGAPSEGGVVIAAGAMPALDGLRRNAFVRVEGLAPGTDYFARFIGVAEDGRRFVSGWHAFRTLRPAGAAPRVWRFGMQSCAVQSSYSKPFIAHRALLGRGLDFMLQLGDWTYIDAHGARAPAGDTRGIYAQSLDTRVDVFEQRLRRETAWFHLWSDHDTGPNNWSGMWLGKPEAVSATILYYDVWDAPGDAFTRGEAHDLAVAEGRALYTPGFLGTAEPLGWNRSFRHGRCEFFLVDPMTYRDEEGGYLGTAQMAWLVQAMSVSTADLLFVVSPGPVGDVQVNEDNWNEFGAERDALLHAIADPTVVDPAKKVVFLVGDRHVPFLTDLVKTLIPGGEGTPIGPEFNSSPVSAGGYSGYVDEQFWNSEAGAAREGTLRAARLNGGTGVVDALFGGVTAIGPNGMLRGVGLVEVDEARGTVRFMLLSGDTQGVFVDGSFGAFDSGPMQLVAPLCPADLNGDGAADTADLGLLLLAFGTGGPVGDVNGDGAVNTADLGLMLTAIGQGCP